MPTGALDGFVSGGSDGGLNPHAYYKLVNRNSGKVLDVFERSTADGAAIVQISDNDGWNQHWQFVDTGGGWYKIVNRLSGKLIDVKGGRRQTVRRIFSGRITAAGTSIGGSSMPAAGTRSRTAQAAS